MLADDALLEQRAVFRDREWTVHELARSLEQGIGFHASLDRTVAGMLAALDGEHTLGDAAADLAQVEGTSRATAEQALLPVAREMLAAGFLERR